MKKLDKFKKLPTIIFAIGFVLIVIGVSYAFFTYSRTGLYTHEIEGGKMGVIYDETTGNNVTLENAFPLTDEEALTRGVEFEWTVTGFNESTKTIYYAIEMEYGNTIDSKTRFSDTDIKLSLYENNNLIFENEIYDNLNKQDIYYGSFPSGTSADNPTVNNYKIRLWINDNVMITDTTDTVDTTNKHVYSTAEFEKKYASFKINVRANLTDMRVGYLTYDANGGENAPEKTSLTTNSVTMERPTWSGKGFLGWATTPTAKTPKYRSGDTYSGTARTLYAVWSDSQNAMATLAQTTIAEESANITEVYFINDSQTNIDERYEAATVKSDLSYRPTLSDNYGSVKGWLEDDPNNSGKYILYIGSDGLTYLYSYQYILSFQRYTSLTKVDFTNLDLSNVTKLNNLFEGCSSLTDFSFDGLDTRSIKDMSFMFMDCSNLVNVDLSNLNTDNLENTSYMFYNCSSLVTLDLGKFNTSKVTDMHSMFGGCKSLVNLNISSFDTKNVTDMSSMFSRCYSLKELNLENFDTMNLEDASYMFDSCDVLTKINLSSFNTSKVTDMSSMFSFCPKLVSLDLSKFKTEALTNANYMFSGCNSLTTLDVSSFDISNVSDISYMFSECTSLTSLDISSFNLSSSNTVLTSFSSIFANVNASCQVKVKDTDAQNWVLTATNGHPSSWSTSNVTVKA